MTNYSAEETLEQRKAALGDEAGAFFRNLEEELYSVRELWACYIGLFGTNPERVDLLNAVSGPTAFQIEKAMREAALLAICRLTDPKETRASRNVERNVTVRRLTTYSKKGADNDLKNLIETAVSAAEFARTFRNKVLAHADDRTANSRGSVTSGSRNDMREAMDAIAACLKKFAESELDMALVTHPIRQGADEVELLKSIYLGKKEMERRELEYVQSFRNGTWRELNEKNSLPEWLTLRPSQEFDV